MKLAVKLIDIGDHILDPICELIDTGMLVNGDKTVGWPDRKGSIHIDKGKVRFDPPISVKTRWFDTTVTDGEIQINRGRRELFLDIDMSPIDVRLV